MSCDTKMGLIIFYVYLFYQFNKKSMRMDTLWPNIYFLYSTAFPVSDKYLLKISKGDFPH